MSTLTIMQYFLYSGLVYLRFAIKQSDSDAIKSVSQCIVDIFDIVSFSYNNNNNNNNTTTTTNAASAITDSPIEIEQICQDYLAAIELLHKVKKKSKGKDILSESISFMLQLIIQRGLTTFYTYLHIICTVFVLIINV